MLEIAILKLEKTCVHGHFGGSDDFKHGSIVYAAGYQGNNLMISKGNVISNGFSYYTTDARADSAYSGGPIIDPTRNLAFGVIKGSQGEHIKVTQFIPLIQVFTILREHNQNANTQIPNF